MPHGNMASTGAMPESVYRAGATSARAATAKAAAEAGVADADSSRKRTLPFDGNRRRQAPAAGRAGQRFSTWRLRLTSQWLFLK